MSEADLTLIKAVYVAFNSRDYESVLAHFAEDFEWIAAESSPLGDRSPYRGIPAIREGVFDRIAVGFELLEVLADEMFTADAGRVIVLGYYQGRFRGSSSEFRTQVAHIWTVREDGKAARFQQYVDTLKISQDAAATASR